MRKSKPRLSLFLFGVLLPVNALAAASQAFVNPRLDFLPVDACVENGNFFLQDHESCGSSANQYAADAFCISNGYLTATSWQIISSPEPEGVKARSFGMEISIGMAFDEIKISPRERQARSVFAEILCDGRNH